MWIAQGRLSEASGWARERGLSAADDLSYVREFEHITLARLLLAQGTRDRSDDAIASGARVSWRVCWPRRRTAGRNGSVIEILVVQALAQRARDDVAGRARCRWSAR